MSENTLIAHIHMVPSWRRLWLQISPQGKRRVLAAQQGEEVLIEDTMRGVLRDEREAKKETGK